MVIEIKTTSWKKATPKDWENVENLIIELRSYKYTPVLARYIYYLKFLKENDIDKAIGVANNIPDDYFGDLRDEVMNAKIEAKALAKSQDMKHYEELIRKGDYETLRREKAQKVTQDKDYSAIYNFLSALNYQNEHIRSAMIVSLSHISIPYNGPLSEEITKVVNQNAAEILHMRSLLSGKTSEGLPKPIIGMTTTEVLASSWGPPDEVSSTMSADGKQEQWEYSNDRVIFIDNGFLSAIQ